MYVSNSESVETEEPGRVSNGFKGDKAAEFNMSRQNLVPSIRRRMSKALEKTLVSITGGANGSVVSIETKPRLKDR